MRKLKYIYRKWMGVNSVAHRIKDIPSHGLRALFQGFENSDYGLWKHFECKIALGGSFYGLCLEAWLS